VKICFIQKEPFPYFGILSLAGYLKTQGIQSVVLIANLEDDLVQAVRETAPDLIGFSVMTPEHGWLVETSSKIKKSFPGIPLIVGGIHAILYPEAILGIPDVDYVCTGEGEYLLKELCDTLANNKNPAGISGIGHRSGDRLVVGDRALLLDSLSTHLEDREVYYLRYPALKNDELKQFIASRGCPYDCSFCFNEQIKEAYAGKGTYVRMKEPEHLLKEIKQAESVGIIKSIFFADDLFTLNKKWLRAFLPLYQKEIALPFMCTTRANLMDDEIAFMLKAAGCHTVSFGVETGCERLRNEVLNKYISDDEIIRCAAVLKKHGIRIQTSNMFCLPDETLSDAFDTVRLNVRIGTDFAFATLFMPFPGTRLTKYCIDHGYLSNDFNFNNIPRSFLHRSILNLSDKERIENLQKISYFLIRYPLLLGFGEYVIKNIKYRFIFAPLIFIGTFLRYKDERRISFFNAIKFLWRFRKSW
jgi:radical SAM superfamily enzyme YgiQ (UPF0313 family)